MAGKSCWINTLARIALTCCAAMAAFAQTAGDAGSLSGRLTDLYTHPVESAALIARNEATGAESPTLTFKNGFFYFASLPEGVYTLQAESPQLGLGKLEGIVVTAGREERLVAAMDFSVALLLEQRQRVLADLRSNQERHELVLTVKLTEITLAEIAPIDLYLAGWWIPSMEMPRTTAIELDEPLSSVPLAEMPLHSVPLPQWEMQLTAPQQIVSLPLQPMETMPLGNTPLSPLSGTSIPTESATVVVQQMKQQTQKTAQTAATTQLTGEELRALPAAGRRWQDFVLDAPNSASAAAGQTEIAPNSAQPAARFDGVAIASDPAQPPSQNDDEKNMGKPWVGGRAAAVGEAALHAVLITASNQQAAEGRAAGGEVNVQTERGSNSWHGQGFLFSKQNLWGAQNPFTQWIKETAPATSTTIPTFTPTPYTPPDRETTWGIGVGHSLRRDKLFAFAALDSYQRNDPGVSMVKHPFVCKNPPSCTEETGFFAQPASADVLTLCARLGLTVQGPQGTQPYCPIDKVTAAYTSLLESLAGLLGPAPRTAAQFVGFGRIDWQASERQRGTLEGIGVRWNAPGGGLTRTAETYGTHSYGSSQASEEFLFGRWQSYITPNLLIVTQASAGRQIQTAHAERPSAFEQSFLSVNAWGQLPQIVVDSRYGFTLGNPSRFGKGSYPDEHLYQLQEQADWAHGAMLLKAGVELNHNADAISQLRNQTGTYTYSSLINFASDALAFINIGITLPLNSSMQPYCDQTEKNTGLFPCYSYYSQTLGPTHWNLSSNDWAGYATAQWQATKSLVFSAGLRWEREQLPPPIARLDNPELPQTERVPSPGNQWGPRLSLALGKAESHWPLLRLGYGVYFGRTENATLETILTQTGSLAGDLNLFMRPTDDCQYCAGGAPPFPYVLRGTPGTIVKPGAIEIAHHFRNPEIHQAVVSAEETLPSHVKVTASAQMSLGRRLPVSIDTNFDTAVNPATITYAVEDASGLGPIKTSQITVPFYASWPASYCPGSAAGECGRLKSNYQQIDEIFSRANSTYEAAMFKVERSAGKGLSLHARYTYAHAMDWNPSEGMSVAGGSVFDPANFNQEYGTSNLDVRHTAAVMAEWETPWKLRQKVKKIANGWMLSGIGQYRSGLPFTMRTSGSLAEKYDTATSAAIAGLAPGMNGTGGDNRVYGVGRNTYRYPATWKADLRLGRRFELGNMRELQLLAESFNLFNHQNVTRVETTGYYLESGSTSGALPTLNFMTGLKANTTAFGQPLNVNATEFFRQRLFQFGLRVKF